MKVKKVLLASVFALCLILSVLLVTSKEVNYALFSGLFTLFAGFMLIQTMKFDKNPQSKYQSTVKNILKTYDVILVEIDNLPDISDRKLVNTTSFKDMVNIEYEFRKPVYYVHDVDSYDFMLLTDEDIYAYTLKKNEESLSRLEKYMSDKVKNQSTNEKQLDVLDNLENTTVIKLDGDKEYVVSPMNNN